jgi:predicted RNA-binding protein YlqC (UPF0109 family)
MVEEFLSEFAKLVVKYPSDIEIKIKNIDSIVDITIIANKSDIGKLIGREGKMIGALKTVISGCKAKNNLTYRIKIEAYSDRE